MRHALAVILLFVVGSASAATIDYSSPGVVTGIGGLDIGGTLYNVDFESGVYSTYGGVEDFWSTQAEAETASNAIISLLNTALPDTCTLNNASQVTPCPVAGGVPGNSFYQVNFTATTKAIGGENVTFIGDIFPWALVTCTATGCPQGAFATAWSVVPIPAAVWLFGSGLGLLGWMKRKRA